MLSQVMFLLTMDWVMKTSTAQGRNGIQWTLWKQLDDDLDFADELALLSHTPHQMQEKASTVADVSARLGLKIHRGKSKVLKVNMVTDTPIMLEGEALGEVETFTYLGSIVDNTGGTEADVRARIGKARAAFQQLKNVWRSSLLGTSTKIRIFNTIVKPVLLYGAETWRSIVATVKRIQTFISTCLRRILKIRWPDIISNQDLWKRTRQHPIEVDILQRRWEWFGHTLRKSSSNITRQALTWNPQVKRKRGRPRNSWRRDLKADMGRNGYTWGELQRVAQDRDDWRVLIGGLCPRRGYRQ